MHCHFLGMKCTIPLQQWLCLSLFFPVFFVIAFGAKINNGRFSCLICYEVLSMLKATSERLQLDAKVE